MVMKSFQSAETEYLCVDRYLRDAVGARALASALELGVIDTLVQAEWLSSSVLAARARLDRSGFMLLASLLRTNGVIDQAGDALSLSADFRGALRFRDLLEAKLDFAAAVAPDFFELFSTLLASPDEFFERAKLFELFSYDRCFDSTPENRAATARWMRFTTVLTRYESAACLANHDFSAHRRMLDVGGNSGEFALRACRAHSSLQATVYDLPVVCELGRQHVRAEPEAGRIHFLEAGPRNDAMPGGHDLITFKSMLHDWPPDHMQQFLDRAYSALRPNGT